MFRSDNRRKKWYDLLGLVPGRVVRWVLILSIIPLMFAVVLGIYAWRASNYDLDHVLTPLANSAVYDADGLLIGTLAGEARVNVTRNELPKNLVNAFIAREDEDFYNHNGVAYTSVIRSALKNIMTFSFAQGASTITMQLARNTYELREKTLDRKILEIAIARRIEKKYDKEAILTSYLNRIYFGQQCFGLAQAAHYYFGKRVQELSLGECATLAGIVRGPSIFNPVANYAAAKRERDDTLDRMVDSGFITEEEAGREKEKELALVGKKTSQTYSYPVQWVNKELDEYDDDMDLDISSVYVMTTFDLNVQRSLELLIEPKIKEVESSQIWRGLPKRIDDMAKGCLQAAAICVETRTGNVLAVVSGRCPLDGVDRWKSPKKPGLMFSPFVNLAAAEANGNIIRNEPEKTGKSVGYVKVMEVAKNIGINTSLPGSDLLYKGDFLTPLLPFIKGCLMLHQRGRDIRLHAVRQIATNQNSLIFDYNNVYDVQGGEVFKREEVYVVSKLPPFKIDAKTKVVSLSVELPDYYGRFHAKIGSGKSFFIWIGFDDPEEKFWKQKGVKNAVEKLAEDIADNMYKKMEPSKK